MLRDGGHTTVLAMIPGTMEQMQAAVLALNESLRSKQMGQRMLVPECPVIQHSFFLIFGFRCVLKRWLPQNISSTASTATLCVVHAGLTFWYI